MDPGASILVLAALIAVALLFDFLNGLHDAANSIATIVSTRVLSPGAAVIWAAFFNFIAFLFFGLHVAQTIGKGIIAPEIVDDAVIFGALGGAIAWNVATWLAGIPSSSSHALIGGLLGAGMAKAGGAAPVLWPGVLKTIAGIVVSPALGFGLALLLVLIVSWAFVKATPARADGVFRRLQFVSGRYKLFGGKKSEDGELARGMPCERIEACDTVNFISEELDPNRLVICGTRLNLYGVATDPELAATELVVIALV